MFIPVNQGVVRRRDPRQLGPGELATGTGLRLVANDSQAHSTGMRQAAGTLGNAAHNGLIFAEFDAGDQILVGLTGSFLFEGSVASGSVNGVPAQLEGGDIGFDGQPDDLVGEVQKERLYLASGVALDVGGTFRNQNLVREADGTYRRMGLLAPGDTISGDYIPLPTTETITPGADVVCDSHESPGASEGTRYQHADNPQQPVTSDGQLFAEHASESNQVVVTIWKFSGTTGDGTAGRLVAADHKSVMPTAGVAVVSQKIEISTDGGATYDVASDLAFPYEVLTSTFAIDGSVLLADIRVKATMTYAIPAGAGHIAQLATGFIGQIRVKITNAAITPTFGWRYVVSEYRSSDDKYGEFSKESAVVSGTFNRVNIPLPAIAQNASSSDFAIWRGTNGAQEGEFDRYSLVGKVPIALAGTTWVDTLGQDPDEVGETVLPILTLGTGDDVEFFQRDLPPPVYYSLAFLGDQLLGLTDADPRQLYYSPKGLWESRPALYALPIESPRNDKPIAVGSLNGIALVWMKTWTKRVRSVTILTGGVFEPTNAEDASPTRGLAGVQAFCTFRLPSQGGKPFWFCIDKRGPYITDGYQFMSWSENINWFDPITEADGEASQALAGLTVCKDNPLEQQIEVRYVPAGGTEVTRRWDFLYGEMRRDGQPKLQGPHYVGNRMVVEGNIAGLDTRWSGGQDGAIYQEGIGTRDDSLAYDASGNVPRILETGYMPFSGLGGLAFVKHMALRLVQGAYQAIRATIRIKQDSGEIQEHTETVQPSANDIVGLSYGGETVQVTLEDTGTVAKTPILGIVFEAEPLGAAGSATRSGAGVVAGTQTL